MYSIEKLIVLLESIQLALEQLEEYLLDANGLVLDARYIMYHIREQRFEFIYCPLETEHSLDLFVEFLVDHMDYGDEESTKIIQKLYELVSDGLQMAELKSFIQGLSLEVKEERESQEKLESEKADLWGEEAFIPESMQVESQENASKFVYTEYAIYAGFLILTVIMILFRPYTPIKVMLYVSLMVMLGAVLFQQKRFQKKEEEKQEQLVVHSEYQKRMEDLPESNETQYIELEKASGILEYCGNEDIKSIPFLEQEQMIGSELESVEVYIKLEGISRMHVSVIKEAGLYWIEDLNSRNGTWVNGERIFPRTRTILNRGDKVSLARNDFIFK